MSPSAQLYLVLLATSSIGNALLGAVRGGGRVSCRLRSVEDALDVAEFSAQFTRLDQVSPSISKYRLAATIKSKDLNSYLVEYKDEMKRRKVVFPGFRAGKLPPYVMPDVRKYLVSYGLETIFGQLCNNNGLEMCEESGAEVAFGEDAFYADIIKTDFREYDFLKQRDAWREGTDFSFVAEFFAKSEAPVVDTDLLDAGVIDAEVVEVDAVAVSEPAAVVAAVAEPADGAPTESDK